MFYHELAELLGDGSDDISLMPAGWFVRGAFPVDEGICLTCEAEIAEDSGGISRHGRTMNAGEVDSSVVELFGGDTEAAGKAELFIQTPYEMRRAAYACFHGNMGIIDIH